MAIRTSPKTIGTTSLHLGDNYSGIIGSSFLAFLKSTANRKSES